LAEKMAGRNWHNYSSRARTIIERCDLKSGKTEFVGLGGGTLRASKGGVVYNGVKYSDSGALLRFVLKKTTDDEGIFLKIVIKKLGTVECFPVDKDLLSELNKYGVKVFGKSALGKFNSSPSLHDAVFEALDCSKTGEFEFTEQTLKAANNGYFSKGLGNKMDNSALLTIAFGAVSFATLIIGIFSFAGFNGEKIALSWVFRLLYTAITSIFIFGYLRNVKIVVTAVNIALLTAYWSLIFINNDRISGFFACIVMLTFGTFNLIEQFVSINKSFFSRFSLCKLIVIGLNFISAIILSIPRGVTYREGNLIFWISFIVGIASAVVALVVMLILKPKWLNKANKRVKASDLVGMVICVALVMGLITHRCITYPNYAFDDKPPIVVTHTITDVRRFSSKGSITYYAYCIEKGKEVEIKITRELYESLKKGDLITVEVYEGAFGLEYYRRHEN